MLNDFLKFLAPVKDESQETKEFKDLANDSLQLKKKVESSIDSLGVALHQIREYQNEVETARNLWELTFNSVDSGLAILNNDSIIINVNQAFVEIVDEPKEDLVGQLICHAFCGIDHGGPHFSPCRECCAQEYVYKATRLYKIHFNRMLDKENELVGCVFVAHDITEENKIQQYLSEMTSKYMGIFKAARDPIILVDVNTKKAQEVNQAFTDLYGWTAQEIVGKSAPEVLSAESEATAKSISACTERIPLRFHKKKDGTIFPVEISSSSYDISGNKYCISIIRDLSDKLNSEILESLQSLLNKIK